MAYYQDEDENQLDPNATPVAQTTGPQSGVVGQDAASAAPQGGPTSNTQTPDRPGNFVGLQDYLNANKSQSSKLGDQVAGQVGSTIEGARQDVADLNPKFNQMADAGQISNIGGASQEAKNIASTAAGIPAGQGLGADQTQRFGEIANAQYKGPNSLIETELYQPTYNKVKDAQNYSTLSKDESGSQQLLKDIYKTPSYGAGENLFDSYLLNSQENRAKLAASRSDASNLDNDFAAANESAAAYAAQQKALAESTKQTAQQALTQTQTERNAQVQAELDAINKNWRSEYDKYLNLLKNSNDGANLNLSPEEAQVLGVAEGQKIYNLLNPAAGNTPEQYLSLQAFDPNKVISKDQQAQLAALDELAGTFGGAQQNKYTQADLAGTLNKAVAFSAEKFGLSAKQADELFKQGAAITNMISEASKADTITDEQSKSVTTYVKDLVERVGGNWWNPFKWFEEVTRAVTTILNIQVQLGNVTSKGKTTGTVADYLAGQTGGTYKDEGGMKNLDWGSVLNPTYIVDQRADNKIDELNAQIQRETQANWAAQIEDYLRKSGYYNQIK